VSGPGAWWLSVRPGEEPVAILADPAGDPPGTEAMTSALCPAPRSWRNARRRRRSRTSVRCPEASLQRACLPLIGSAGAVQGGPALDCPVRPGAELESINPPLGVSPPAALVGGAGPAPSDSKAASPIGIRPPALRPPAEDLGLSGPSAAMGLPVMGVERHRRREPGGRPPPAGRDPAQGIVLRVMGSAKPAGSRFPPRPRVDYIEAVQAAGGFGVWPSYLNNVGPPAPNSPAEQASKTAVPVILAAIAAAFQEALIGGPAG